jgi:hypothetical protein
MTRARRLERSRGNGGASAGQSVTEALEDVREVIAARPDVEPGSIRVTADAISFRTRQNILATLRARTAAASAPPGN